MMPWRCLVSASSPPSRRGTEWAATGRVTQKVPKDFPTADTVSYRADLAAMDPAVADGVVTSLPPPK